VDVTAETESILAIAAGSMHTCALTASGGAVKCWGNNQLGQVGNGVPASFKTPVDTVGLNAGMTSISAGNGYSCGVSASGGAKCWGANGRGQLGNGTTTHALTPVDVTAIGGGTVAISSSKGWLGGHTCALTSGSGAKCWGDNDYGQLGDGTTVTSLSPVDVTGLTAGVASVATGEYHACALKMGGEVLCWGRGYLGNGTTSGSLTPATVIGLPQSVLAIAAGAAHTCALTAGGGVKCWGFNGHGQIGNGTISDALSAVDATGMTTGVAAITAAYDHSCALTTVGGIKCWGNNVWGQLGTGDTTDHRTAVDVAGIASGAVAVTAGGSVEWVGGSHTCALVVGGGVKCWGANEFGQLGNGNTANAYAPVDVAGLMAGATTVSAGTDHTCAVTTAGAVKCWGSNRGGQLGNGIAGYFTTAQNVLTVAQNGIPAVLQGAVSRKNHGAGGSFDLVLNLPHSNPTTEPRSGGASGNHTIVFLFDRAVSGGTALVTAGGGTAGTPTFSGNEMVVPLTGVANQQYVTVFASDVTAADGSTGGSGSVRIGFLLADVNGNRVVTVSDLAQVNAQIAQVVTASNYLRDVNASGALTVADKGIANTQITKALPPP